MEVHGSSPINPLPPEKIPQEKKPSILGSLLSKIKGEPSKEFPRSANSQKLKEFKEAFAEFKQALEQRKNPAVEAKPAPLAQKTNRLDADIEDAPIVAKKKPAKEDFDPDVISTVLRQAEKLAKSEEARFGRFERGTATFIDNKRLESRIQELKAKTAELKDPSKYTWSFTDRLRATPTEIRMQISGIVSKVLKKDDRSQQELITNLRQGGFVERFKELATILGNARIILDSALKPAISEAEDALAAVNIAKFNPKTASAASLLEKYETIKQATTKLVSALEAHPEYELLIKSTAQKKQPENPIAAPKPAVKPLSNQIAEELKELQTKKAELSSRIHLSKEPLKEIMDRLGNEGLRNLNLEDVKGLSEDGQNLLIDMSNLLTQENALQDELRIQKLAEAGIRIKHS